MNESKAFVVTFTDSPTNSGAKILGRPKGTNRPATLEIRYPINWRPIYDLFVADTLAGLSIKAIAIKHSYSPVQVGNILSSPLGKAKFSELREKIETLSVIKVSTFEDVQKRLKEKAYKVAEDFLDDERGLASATPLAFVDRAIKIANLGEGKSSFVTNTQINNQQTLIISAEAAANVTQALMMSRELGLSLSKGAALEVIPLAEEDG
jgi:hypothetical protein